MKTYETKFVNSAHAAETAGLEGYEVKSSHINSVGQPVIIMQREMSLYSEPERWPSLEDQLAVVSVTKTAIEKAAMQ
jgi:hypothetical protein